MDGSSEKLPFPGILAVDLDGTLLRSDHTVSDRTGRTLRELKKRGCVPVISTGRNYQGVLPFIDRLRLESPVITSNGAMICDGSNGSILHEWPLPDDITLRTLEEARKRNIHFQGFSHESIYYEKRGKEAEFYEDVTGLHGHIVNFDEWHCYGFIKALMIGPPGRPSGEWPELHDAQQKLQNLFGSRLHSVFSRPFYLDFMSGECSKGTALRRLSRDFSIERSRVTAFGDALNDMDMLEYAGISVAMKNAPEPLRDKCSHVTGYTNDEDGVAEFIENNFF